MIKLAARYLRALRERDQVSKALSARPAGEVRTVRTDRTVRPISNPKGQSR
jgi:hypothetical protein